MIDYERWLRSPDWAAIRRDRIIEGGWRCERCGFLAYDLELHHKHYVTLGHESQRDLELLCKVCHRRADIERQQNTAATQWAARLNGWAQKVYGDNWELSYAAVEEHFCDWLAVGGADE